MIPWRLKFSGIRDYLPTVIDLAEETDHILISGPNGAGKSTITFCWGAVLYSSKVDLEGLRSQNLPPDQTWHATIELAFKNAGQVKVDAAQFVQFSLHIEQHSGEPIKKVFFIHEGDELDHWERSVKFTAGDQNYNFSEYKKQVTEKYAVDPDAFYLIWYQKEVNQFAVMHPEERFRIFSQMYGIETIQKNWEESRELVKEAEQSLQEAENNLRNKKLELSQKKKELDRYHDRNRRLEEGLKQYWTALKVLETIIGGELDTLQKQILKHEEEIETLVEAAQQLETERTALEQHVQHLKQAMTECEHQLSAIQEQMESKQEQKKRSLQQKQEIERKITHLTEKIRRIPYSEEQVRQQLDHTQKQLQSHLDRQSALQAQAHDIRGQLDQLRDILAKLQAEIYIDQQKEARYADLLQTYHSSHAVQSQLEHVEQQLEAAKERTVALTKEKQQLETLYGQLTQNRLLSARQEQALLNLQRAGIEAYPLRELVELDAAAGAADEYRFETVKYTIFVNARTCQPCNDLYHVPLPGIIPEHTVTRLPELRLQIKENLDESLYPFAVKALWWIKRFFSGEMPKIANGLLIDTQGIRGPQEEKRLILSEAAIQRYKEEVRKQIKAHETELAALVTHIEQLRQQQHTLTQALTAVKEAEAFQTTVHERLLRQTKFQQFTATKEQLLQKEKDLRQQLEQLSQPIAACNWEIRQLEAYAAVYQEYASEREQIEQLHFLEKAIQQLEHAILQEKAKEEVLKESLEQKGRQHARLKRQHDDLLFQLDEQKRKLDRTEQLLREKREEYVAQEEEMIEIKREMSALEDKVPRHLEQFQATNGEWPAWNKSQAKNNREQGKTTFEFALNEKGIDEAAPENYRIIKEEYERLSKEVDSSRALLEEQTARMERLKDDLETTINMRVLEVNQKFFNYMSHFHFEGKVEWDMYADRRNQIHYALFLKARKEGHRGKMEDVSVKARGGKVGRGVSGGEESLSSLLFALALMQNIQASPGYIVLDEFDSALDEGRKEKVFDLYERELQRKLIILTPKSHEADYLYRFSKAYVVSHDPSIPESRVFKVMRDKKRPLT